MKKTRLIVLPNTNDAPKGFHISEAFESRADYDEFVNRAEVEESAVRIGAGCVALPDPARVEGLRMLMVLMAHPFFALSRRATPIDYRSTDGSIFVKVEPGPNGMATIQDADVLMYAIDSIAAAGADVDRELVIKPGGILKATGAATGGLQYRALAKAMARLTTTRVTTNAQPDGKPGPVVTFNWLEAAGRLGKDWQITAPAWIAEGARSSAILKVSSSYFDLRGLSRGIYLVARKHVGQQDKPWLIRTSKLWLKLGSSDTLAHFRHNLKKLAAADQLPDFRLAWEEGTDGMLYVSRRSVGFSNPILVI
jgi:plasmid replication initiation protein